MILNAINFCDGLKPNVIGCAPGSGTSLAVIRFNANQEGIIWAHEFGHTRGLPHRNSPTAVMNGTVGTNLTRVTSSECSAYRNLDQASLTFPPTLLPAAGKLAPGYSQILARFQPAESQEPSSQLDIVQFVRQTFTHGVPYNEAIKYPIAEAPKLVEMLKNRNEQRYWQNIVVVLGMIGDEGTLSELLAFISRDRGAISVDHYRAKTALIMSLGYVINRTGSRRALDYLKSGLDPKVWAARVGANLSPYHKSTIERNNDFAKHALLGLALSGNAEAASALRSLQDRAGDASQQRFRTEVSELIVEALKEHQAIASQGLAAYYRARGRE